MGNIYQLQLVFLACIYAVHLLVFGCDTTNRGCPSLLKPGLLVTVRDSTTQVRICDATATIIDAFNHTTLLQQSPQNPPFSETCQYWGLQFPEQEGDYTLVVSRDGYQTQTISVQMVAASECFLKENSVEMNLVPVIGGSQRL